MFKEGDFVQYISPYSRELIVFVTKDQTDKHEFSGVVTFCSFKTDSFKVGYHQTCWRALSFALMKSGPNKSIDIKDCM